MRNTLLVAAFAHHALLRFQEICHVSFAHVVVCVAKQIVPRADELRIRRNQEKVSVEKEILIYRAQPWVEIDDRVVDVVD